MSSDFSYALAFATGLFGSFHCIGMCSGINGGFTLGYGRFSNPFPLLAYHGARIGVYALFGIIGALLPILSDWLSADPDTVTSSGDLWINILVGIVLGGVFVGLVGYLSVTPRR